MEGRKTERGEEDDRERKISCVQTGGKIKGLGNSAQKVTVKLGRAGGDRSPHLSAGDVHENGEAGHVIALAADVGVVSEHHLTPLR